jgi:peptide/nickel transport system permease protein
MAAYLLRRMINYLFLVIIAASVTYLLAAFIFHPEDNWLARHPQPSAATIRAELLARNEWRGTPIWTRYGHWVDGLLHGNLGVEIGGGSVAQDMVRRVGVSTRLLLIATVVGSVGGVVVGVWGAVRQYKVFDRVTTFGSLLIYALPVFTLAILLQMFAVWFNNATNTQFLYYVNEVSNPNAPFWTWSDLVDRFQHLILPTLSISLGSVAFFSRYQRATMLDVMGSDFLRTARAKGLTKNQAIFKHGARTAIIPVATLLSYSAVLLFTGALYTEIIFTWHGMGEWAVTSISSQDVNSTAAVGIFTAILVLIAGLISEIITVALDPRVRL